MVLPLSEETLARAEAELSQLRQQGDRLEQELHRRSSRGSSRTSGITVARTMRRTVERDGFSVVRSSMDADLMGALAAEDVRVGDDLARMRAKAEREAERRALDESRSQARRAELEQTRKDIEEAARVRDALRMEGESGAHKPPGPLSDAVEDALPLAALAEQARMQLRCARKNLDIQRARSKEVMLSASCS